MSTFPIALEGIVYPGVEALAAEMERWARIDGRRHRGDVHPADRFRNAPEEAQPALREAAALLLSRSDDSRVLELVAHLDLVEPSEPLYRALVERMAGGAPLPSGRGLRHGDLRGELLHLLSAWAPPGADALKASARAVLATSGRPQHQLAFALRHGGTPEEILALVQQAGAHHERDPALYASALLHLVAVKPDLALQALSAFQPRTARVRDHLRQQLQRREPAWFAQEQAAVTHALG